MLGSPQGSRDEIRFSIRHSVRCDYLRLIHKKDRPLRVPV